MKFIITSLLFLCFGTSTLLLGAEQRGQRNVLQGHGNGMGAFTDKGPQPPVNDTNSSTSSTNG